MNGWQKIKLDELLTITSSKRIKRADYVNSGIPFFRSKEIIELNKGNNISTELFITKSHFNDIKIRFGVPCKGDILLTSVGTLGVPYIVEKEFDFYFKDGNLTWFKDFDQKLNNKFLFYWLSSTVGQKRIKEISIGSTQQALTIIGLKSLEIDLPTLEKQEKIVKILDSICNKIQLNTETNQTLENIAQAIFKSWFIDFDPVHTKANALANGDDIQTANRKAMMTLSGKTDTELTEMAQQSPTEYAQLHQTAQAFPSEFGENGLPLGWEMKLFGNLLDKTIGGDWGKEIPDEKHTEKVAIFRGTDLPKVYEGAINDVPIRYVENKKLQARRLQHGDIVIEVSGGSKNQPTGRSLLITEKLLSQFEMPIAPASFCRLFRPQTVQLGYLLSIHLQNIYKEGKTWEYQNQSTGISNFQTKIFLEKELVIIPPNEILEKFHNIIVSILDKRYSTENKLLQEIRDTLLPKLLSGEIEI